MLSLLFRALTSPLAEGDANPDEWTLAEGNPFPILIPLLIVIAIVHTIWKRKPSNSDKTTHYSSSSSYSSPDYTSEPASSHDSSDRDDDDNDEDDEDDSREKGKSEKSSGWNVHRYAIVIVNEEGDRVPGSRVDVSYYMTQDSAVTDDDGVAYFEHSMLVETSFDVKVTLENGDEHELENVTDGDRFPFTLT